ncbi:MAG: Flp family type IVb pilin, partial [Marmoricola sp.]
LTEFYLSGTEGVPTASASSGAHLVRILGGIHMNYMRNLLARRTEDGASAVEYGLLVAGIAALIVAVVFLFGGMVKNVFSSTCNGIHTNAASQGTTISGACS